MKKEYTVIDRNVARKDKLRHNVETKRDSNEPPLFFWIEFNLTGLCNRVCVFCPRVNPKKFPNLNEHLPIEIYTNVMKDLSKEGFKGGILYSAFSEPILYKYLEEVIKINVKKRIGSPRVGNFFRSNLKIIKIIIHTLFFKKL
jgi:hypothetical protein